MTTLRKIVSSAVVGAAVGAVSFAGTAQAANGYVLNDTASIVTVIGADGLYRNVAPYSSSAAVTRDADYIRIGPGQCIWIDGRAVPGVGPKSIPVGDGAIRHVTRLQRC